MYTHLYKNNIYIKVLSEVPITVISSDLSLTRNSYPHNDIKMHHSPPWKTLLFMSEIILICHLETF